MSMMGSVVGPSGLSFEDVIGMLKDEPAYQAKLRELQKRTEEARAVMAQAVEIGRKTEENKKLVQSMLDQTTQQVLEANSIKAVAEKLKADAIAHETQLQMQQEAWTKQVAAEKEQSDQQLHDTFVTIENEIKAKEQKLLADTKEFEARQADEQAKIEAFMTFKKSTEAKLAQREAALKQGDNELAVKMAEASAMKQELKSKLTKLKEVAAS
jgi:hypothetical protein